MANHKIVKSSVWTLSTVSYPRHTKYGQSQHRRFRGKFEIFCFTMLLVRYPMWDAMKPERDLDTFFKSRTFSRSNAWNGATACKEIVQASSCKKTDNLSISLSITINYGEKRKSSYNKQYHCHIWAVDDLRKAQEIMNSGQLWAQSKASNLQTLVSSLYLQVTVQRQWWSL